MRSRLRDRLMLVEPRRRRRVARLLRRMERLETVSTRRARRAGRGHRAPHRRSAAAVTVLVLALGGVLVATLLDRSPVGASAFPDRPGDARDEPIAAPRALTRASDAFAFTSTQDGSGEPVTYDPCVPIHLVVNPRTIVDDGMRMLDEALDQVSEATGLSFVVDGTTEAGSRTDGTVTDDDGKGWLPVAVSWSDPQESAKLEGGIAGYAGSASIERDGHRWYVTGSVVLDGPQLDDIVARKGGWASARSVLMHELAHLVGLDHVDDPGQLMQPEGDADLTTWGAGDLTGLAAAGRGRCIDY